MFTDLDLMPLQSVKDLQTQLTLQSIDVAGTNHCPEAQGQVERILGQPDQQSFRRGRRQNIRVLSGHPKQQLNQLLRIASLDGYGKTDVIVVYREVA